MSLTIAALRSGTDPRGPLPPGAFHRTLDDQISCPRCDALYNLIADFDQTNDRFFAESSRRLLLLLRKAIFLGHNDGHRVSHFETSGTVVRAFGPEEPTIPSPARSARGDR